MLMVLCLVKTPSAVEILTYPATAGYRTIMILVAMLRETFLSHASLHVENLDLYRQSNQTHFPHIIGVSAATGV